MPVMKDVTDDFERIQTVLFYMTTDRFITEPQACDLLWPLLEGSPALERVLKVHGPNMLAERCFVRAKEGVFAED
ncbi:MAG TPA: hypothetical protein VJ921_03475 [Vicinamibacteria bacterium]|jgi:hypothetical protein|nr:hypothetical protein [Vicinamibacteria bacterium]